MQRGLKDVSGPPVVLLRLPRLNAKRIESSQTRPFWHLLWPFVSMQRGLKDERALASASSLEPVSMQRGLKVIQKIKKALAEKYVSMQRGLKELEF